MKQRTLEWHTRLVTWRVLTYCRNQYRTPLPSGLLNSIRPGWLKRQMLDWVLPTNEPLRKGFVIGRKFPAIVKWFCADSWSAMLAAFVRILFPPRPWLLARYRKAHNAGPLALLDALGRHWVRAFQVVFKEK